MSLAIETVEAFPARVVGSPLKEVLERIVRRNRRVSLDASLESVLSGIGWNWEQYAKFCIRREGSLSQVEVKRILAILGVPFETLAQRAALSVSKQRVFPKKVEKPQPVTFRVVGLPSKVQVSQPKPDIRALCQSLKTRVSFFPTTGQEKLPRFVYEDGGFYRLQVATQLRLLLNRVRGSRQRLGTVFNGAMNRPNLVAPLLNCKAVITEDVVEVLNQFFAADLEDT